MRALLAALVLTACGDADPEPHAADGCAAPVRGGVSAALAERLQAATDGYRTRVGAPGAVAGVVVPGAGTWVGVTGTRDVLTGEPTDSQGAYAWGSITKTVVAALVLQLVDEGRVSLQDPLSTWYPDVPNAERIRVVHLLNHTSGIRDYTETDRFYSSVLGQDGLEVTVEDVIDAAAADSPVFEPGAAYSYSNTNYFLLGRIAEVQTGQGLADLLRARLLEPAGLERTWLLGDEDPPPCVSLTPGHVAGAPDLDIDPDWQWASGGLAGDIDDLLRWIEVLLHGDLVPAAYRVVMITPGETPALDGGPSEYGLGMAIRSGPCAAPMVGHTGSTMGYQSDVFQLPDGTTVAVLQNDFVFEVSELAYALCDVVEP